MANLIDSLPAGELRFRFIAGRPCLHSAATVGERSRRWLERLRTHDDLGRWLVEAGTGDSPPAVKRAQLEAARAVRDAIYVAARSAGKGTLAPDDVAEINRWAARLAPAPQLDRHGRVRSVAERPVEAALAAIARDAIDLIGGPLATRARGCAAEDHALVFVTLRRPDGADGARWTAAAIAPRPPRIAAVTFAHMGGADGA